MEQQVKVSVIMPVYNAAKYLDNCLDSVVKQTLKEMEIICVDDGSTDASGEILEKYREKDSRIRILHQQNLYAGCARNAGLKEASGKYVIFWDSDDYFEKRALEKLYARCEKDRAQIGICGAERVDEETQISYPAGQYLQKERLPARVPFSKRELKRDLFNFCSNVPWNKLFLRSFVQEHNLQFQPLRQANDVYFVMLALFFADRITVVKQPLIHYRIYNSASLSGRAGETRYCTVEAFRAVLHVLEEQPEFTEEIRRSFSAKSVGPLLTTLRLQNGPAAYKELYDYYKQAVFPEFFLTERRAEDFNNAKDYEDVTKLLELEYQDYLIYQVQSQERWLNMTRGQLAECRRAMSSPVKFVKYQSRRVKNKLKRIMAARYYYKNE